MPDPLVISNLDQTATLGAVATHSGYNKPIPTTTAPDFPDGTLSLANARSMFTFYTTPTTGTPFDITNGSSANWTAVAKTSIADAFVHGDVGSSASGPLSDAMGVFARAIFGSAAAADLFSNAATIYNEVDTIFTNSLTAINADTSTTTTYQVGNAMLKTNTDRFGMDYGAVFTPNSTKNNNTNPVVPYTMVPVVATSGGGTGAGVSIVLGGNQFSTTVESLIVTTTGSGYAAGDSVSFTQGSDFSGSISSLTTIQAAMLNGTLGSNLTPTSFPFEVGDRMVVKYQISMNSSQTNASGNLVDAALGTYSAMVPFVIVA